MGRSRQIAGETEMRVRFMDRFLRGQEGRQPGNHRDMGWDRRRQVYPAQRSGRRQSPAVSC